MSAIERCRTAALGGHVERCEDCAHLRISYNSCGNRHCPKCQAAAAKEWLADRQAELLPVPYFHVVFSLPGPIADIGHQNQAVVYDLLLKTAAETLITIAADPKHLGARIGLTAVLHTWGSALTHHPHAHIIVPGGGLSPDGQHWIACRPRFFLSVEVLSCLFRRRFLERLTAAYQAGRLEFFADHAGLAEPARFKAYVAALRKVGWVVYAKQSFGGPGAVLAYLSRYTHRIAIANSRLVAFDGTRVTFKWKDYRAQADNRYKRMTLNVDEFIRRFLIHILPDGFHRIRHYGLFANANRAGNIALARRLLGVPDPAPSSGESDGTENRHEDSEWNTCPCCGGRMVVIEIFQPGGTRNATPRFQIRSTAHDRHRPLTTLQCCHTYRSSSIGSGPARPMTAVVRQLTAAAMAVATHSSPCQVPPPLHPAVDPTWRSPRPRRSRLPAALKSP